MKKPSSLHDSSTAQIEEAIAGALSGLTDSKYKVQVKSIKFGVPESDAADLQISIQSVRDHVNIEAIVQEFRENLKPASSPKQA